MTKTFFACYPNDTMEHAYALMNRCVTCLSTEYAHCSDAQGSRVPVHDLLKNVVEPCVSPSLSALRMKRKALPVIREHDEEAGPANELMGMLKYRDVVKALQANKGQQQVKAWTRREVSTVREDATLTALENVLIEGQTGRLHVVSSDNTLLGLITRTDILRQQQMYEKMNRRVA